jgi:hypothetical protein
MEWYTDVQSEDGVLTVDLLKGDGCWAVSKPYAAEKEDVLCWWFVDAELVLEGRTLEDVRSALACFETSTFMETPGFIYVRSALECGEPVAEMVTETEPGSTRLRMVLPLECGISMLHWNVPKVFFTSFISGSAFPKLAEAGVTMRCVYHERRVVTHIPEGASLGLTWRCTFSRGQSCWLLLLPDCGFPSQLHVCCASASVIRRAVLHTTTEYVPTTSEPTHHIVLQCATTPPTRSATPKPKMIRNHCGDFLEAEVAYQYYVLELDFAEGGYLDDSGWSVCVTWSCPAFYEEGDHFMLSKYSKYLL